MKTYNFIKALNSNIKIEITADSYTEALGTLRVIVIHIEDYFYEGDIYKVIK